MNRPPPPGPPQPPAGPRPDEPPLRVTTLELFFDLVFAFTLTQLTALLSGDLALTGLLQVLMIFGLLWWMYGGYAWLYFRVNKNIIRLAPFKALAGGAALFLAGDVAFRRLLGLGPVLIRAITSAAVLATIALGVTATIEAQLALVAAMLAAMLVAEHYLAGASQVTGDIAAG
jgi:hypothetical protein